MGALGHETRSLSEGYCTEVWTRAPGERYNTRAWLHYSLPSDLTLKFLLNRRQQKRGVNVETEVIEAWLMQETLEGAGKCEVSNGRWVQYERWDQTDEKRGQRDESKAAYDKRLSHKGRNESSEVKDMGQRDCRGFIQNIGKFGDEKEKRCKG